ncbi:MAG: hypothetical protein H7Y11_05760 [Armatimonadetes bacterium]|nr:hypothetical protein [Anaerolineae bacterium]
MTWFYKPPRNLTTEAITEHFDFFTLTRNDEADLATIQQLGSQPVLQYVKYDAVHDPCQQALKPIGTPCRCTQELKDNQVAWEADDICWIRDNHPEWLLRDADGEVMYFQGYLMLDPGQQGWRDFWVERLEISHLDGWDGVFIDNLATRFGRHHDDLRPLQAYSTDLAYQDAVVGFFEDVRQRFFLPNEKLIFANISVRRGDLPVYLRYLDHLDGVMDEFWAYPRTGWYALEEWMTHLERMTETVNRGKRSLLIAQGTQANAKRQTFGFASYLLLASDLTYFRYTTDQDYRNAWLYDNYLLPLGQPIGAYRRNENQWQRDFENGQVTVNPDDRSAAITVFNPDGEC